jgi:hypothetical protein
MKKLTFCLLMVIYVAAPQPAKAQQTGSDTSARWSQKRIWEWYKQQPWICGFNYIPAYAINYTAMWDKTSFDANAIDKELALAQAAGMNVLRAVLQFVVYEDDPAYFLRTLDQFMDICSKRGIRFVPALFDDCAFGINHDPVVGRQPEPLAGWYAWAWSPSPGHSLVVDPSTHPRIEKYVKAVMQRFKDDDRILFWDLYNEPTNGGLGTATFPLLRKVIGWAHEVKPSQPLSISIFDRNPRLNAVMLDASDLVSFHNYGNLKETEQLIKDLKKHGRPVVCTEWMNRPAKSLVATHIALFHREKVGCMLWGLVNGKTQTDLPWGHRPGDPAPPVWQHDLFRPDLNAYDTMELDTIRRYTSMAQ